MLEGHIAAFARLARSIPVSDTIHLHMYKPDDRLAKVDLDNTLVYSQLSYEHVLYIGNKIDISRVLQHKYNMAPIT
jgi:hypothetical protein